VDEVVPLEYDEEFESDFKTKETNQEDIVEKSARIFVEILVLFAALYFVYEVLPYSIFIFSVILGIIIHFYLWMSGKRKKFWFD